MNFEIARTNMIKQQLRTWDILDKQILALYSHIPREEFVPDPYLKFAFADTMIPIGHDQKMLNPKEEARLLQALEVKASDNILVVGTGTGYLTALLARLGEHVYSVDDVQDFLDQTRRHLDKFKITNVTLEHGDASQGWAHYAPYDVIVIAGALPALPQAFLEQLKTGGRLFAFIGKAPAMSALKITHTEDQQFEKTILFETVIPALAHTQPKDEFLF